MVRSLMSLVLAVVVGFAADVRADFSETFTGGITPGWVFFDNAGNAPPDATTISVVSNELHMLGRLDQLGVGNFDEFAVGLFGLGQPSQMVSDVTVRTDVRRLPNATITGAGGNGNNDVFVITRSDGLSSYLLALDFNDGGVDLVRTDFGAIIGLGAGSSADVIGFNAATTYTLELTAIGNQLTGLVYDGLTLVASVSATDSTYAAGWAGIGAAINENATIGGPGGPGRTLIAAAFDNVSAVTVPVPGAAWAGLALLGVMGLRRRR